MLNFFFQCLFLLLSQWKLFFSMFISTLEPLAFSSLVCFLLKNEIKWNPVNHRKWSGLLRESNASCSSTKVQTVQYIISSFLEIATSLPNHYRAFFPFFKFYFVLSNLLSLQWRVLERNWPLKADSPTIESRICLSLVVWPGTRHSLWA